MLPMFLSAQRHSQAYRIKIEDNRNLQYNSYEYLFKDDSLTISGMADFGRTRVSYLKLKLTKKQRKTILNYLKTFPLDSLQKEYHDDYHNFGYIAADHFPRVIDLEIRVGLKQYFSKAANAYVNHYGRLIQFLNDFIPDETVRIKFKESDFKKSY